ncbi:MAG: hypothetical protein QGG09_18050, partial [Pirellulaceae bacterium]|nr:hypothetical protein [Pirellulaceae bacterium]
MPQLHGVFLDLRIRWVLATTELPMLPFLCIACLTLATPEPHPEMRAMLEASRARDPNQLIQADPLELQAIVNSVPRPSSGIELASVRD